MTTPLAPLPIDAGQAAAEAWQREMLALTVGFLADNPCQAGNAVLDLLEGGAATLAVADSLGPLLRVAYRDTLEFDDACDIADAWDSGGKWWRRQLAAWKAENPRDALFDAISQLSNLALGVYWGDDTEYVVWRMAILNQPPAGMAETRESEALIAEIKAMHAVTGGWWAWQGTAEDGPAFLATAQWEEVYRRRGG